MKSSRHRYVQPARTDGRDTVEKLLNKAGVPITRENYLNLAYLGKPPIELSYEEEMEIPEHLREPDALPIVSQQRYKDVSILTLQYVWPNGKSLRFTLFELATPAVQTILRICNSLYGQARIAQDGFVALDEGEVRDAEKFLAVLDGQKNSDVIRIVWRWWDAGYERSCHGSPSVVDLGEIDD